MKWRLLLIICTALGLVCISIGKNVQAEASDGNAIGERLQQRIAREQTKQRFTCRSEMICGVSDLPAFYLRRGYQPAWINANGPLPHVSDLLRSINLAHREGLHPEDYHLKAITALLLSIQQTFHRRQPVVVEELIDLELLCTDAFLLLASHFLAGRVNPESIHSNWIVNIANADLAAALQDALENDRIQQGLMALLPPHAGYTALQNELQRYRRLASSVIPASIAPGPSLRAGDRDPRIPSIRNRLIAYGDLSSTLREDPDLFDAYLETGIRRFQKRHGLAADGVIGDRTTAALNVTLAERIHQIELNMERWRWIPHELGNRHLLVNIADYQLDVVENGRTVLQMKAVVGKPYRRTPVFSDTLKYLEINPYWNVPTSIAVKDLLPKIQKDADYLSKMDFKIFSGWEQDASEIQASSIDWSQITARNFKFRLRQEPGPQNALGRIKFMFPNRFAVYLHDTPSRDLFQQSRRGFSSGCIRLEKPIDLAAYVLEGQADWDRTRIIAAIDSGQRSVVALRTEIDIHLLYWTAWVDSDGVLHFLEDIYQRDKPLAAALNERPPRWASGEQTEDKG